MNRSVRFVGVVLLLAACPGFGQAPWLCHSERAKRAEESLRLGQELGVMATQSHQLRSRDVSWLVKPENRPRTGDRGPGVFHPSSVSGLRSFHDWNPPGEEAKLSSPSEEVYGAEFGGALVGSCLSALAGYGIYSTLEPGLRGGALERLPGVAAISIYFLTSPFLSAAGTHLAGNLVGQEGRFWDAVIGGAIGDVLGAVAFYGSISYQAKTGRVDGRPGLAIWLVLPPIGSVAAYNVWKGGNNGEW